jgi:hypothetical protein
MALLLSMTAGRYFYLIFITIIAGPFSFLGFYFGIPGVVPSDSLTLLNALLYSLGLGAVNSAMILSHSYKQTRTFAFLTVMGCLIWVFLGIGVAFVGV